MAPIVDSGDSWLRFYGRFPASSPLLHFDVAAMLNSTNGGTLLYVEDSQPYTWFEETGSFYATTTIVDRDRWICFELHLAVSDTTGAFDLYVDGVPIKSVTGRDTHPLGGYDLLEIGIASSQPTQTPTAIEIDEVAVGTVRLPCD